MLVDRSPGLRAKSTPETSFSSPAGTPAGLLSFHVLRTLWGAPLLVVGLEKSAI